MLVKLVIISQEMLCLKSVLLEPWRLFDVSLVFCTIFLYKHRDVQIIFGLKCSFFDTLFIYHLIKSKNYRNKTFLWVTNWSQTWQRDATHIYKPYFWYRCSKTFHEAETICWDLWRRKVVLWNKVSFQYNFHCVVCLWFQLYTLL